MSHCPHCGLTFSDASATPAATPEECPNCGRALARPPAVWESASAPIRRYFLDLWEIIIRPARFFRRMPLRGGVSGPLAFALITHWLGSSVEFLWRSLLGGMLSAQFTGLFKMAGDIADVDSPGRGHMILEMRDRVVHWIWGAGSVIVDPFLTLASILFTSLLVFIGARILVSPGKNGAPEEVTFESALRIICFGMSPAILAALPFFGGVISNLWIVVVTVIGAREVYRISSGRAVVVGLFPKVLFLGILTLGFLLVALLFLKLMATAF